jgi:hypothetical protein
MLAAATLIATPSLQQMLPEMVHDRVANGVTTAAIRRCGKQMENNNIFNLPG